MKKLLSVCLAALCTAGLSLPAVSAPSYAAASSADGADAALAVASQISAPSGLYLSADGSTMITDEYRKVIWRQTREGTLSVYAGKMTAEGADGIPMGGYLDGKREQASFSAPWAVVSFLSGYAVSDTNNHAIRFISGDQVVTAAGGGAAGLQNGPAAKAAFSRPTGLAADDDGNLYIADTGNHVIRRLSRDGSVTTFAGASEGCADGAASQARFREPTGLYWQGGVLYVADSGNHRVCKIENGVVATLAGGLSSQSEDPALQTAYRNGPVSTARFSNPQGVAATKDGTIYVADTGNHAVRRIRNGYVSTLPITDSGQPVNLLSPRCLVLEGTLLRVSDPFSHKIHELNVADANIFSDVAPSAWYAHAISFSKDYGIFSGVSADRFEPETPMTRAMAAAALYNMYRSTSPDEILTGTAPFPDTSPDAWYSAAVGWAAAQGIVKGDASGLFRPEEKISREELAVMLYQYAKTPDGGGDLSIYADAGGIQPYALPAFRWACGAGLISGSNSRLHPASSATRAETAQILKNFALMDVKK